VTEEEMLESQIMNYLLEQKMLGRDSVYESEIFEALGYPWDEGEDRLIGLTESGEQEISRRDGKSFLN
jgi:hypothetical protein